MQHRVPGSTSTVGKRALLADGRALVADFMRFGGRRLGVAIALMLAGGVLEGVGLAMLVPIFSLLAPEAGGRWRALAVDFLSSIGLVTPLERLGGVLLAFCLLIAARAVVLSARDRLVFDLSQGFVDHRRLMIVRDLAHARWSALARLRHARVAHLLSSEVAKLALACSVMLQILMAGIMLAIQAMLMIALSPALAVPILGVALLGLFVLVPLSRRAADVGTSTARFAFRIAGEAAQFMGGLKIAVAHDAAEAFVANIAHESARLLAQQDAQQRFQSHVAIASASIASLVGAAMVFGAVMFGVPTVTLLAALVVLGRMSGPVRTVQANVQQLFGILPAFAALRALRADLGEPASGGSTSTRHAPHGTIRLERVTFRYPDAPRPVIAALDLAIDAGALVGLSGPSGAGKTTLVDLLAGLLTPTDGRIMVGDMVLTPEILGAWRRRLAYVVQDSYLINDTLRRNLTWGGEERPETALWAALADAGAADLVAAMPDGLDTPVDERGTRLSGGERQRIALARAILRDAGLLILDEATNAIDIATEHAVLANLRRALPTATILVVAHRAETLRRCDRVITLQRQEAPPATA